MLRVLPIVMVWPSFAAKPTNLRTGLSLTATVLRSMSSKRLSSDTTKPTHVVTKDKKHKKPKVLKESSTGSQYDIVAKETDQKAQSFETQSFKGDIAKIESMTVQELRTTLRSIGASVKGRKQDLVSALSGFMKQQQNGGSSCCGEDTAQQKEEDAVDESQEQMLSSVSEISVVNRSRRTVKKFTAGDKRTKVVAQTTGAEEKLSVQTDIIPVAEPWTVLAHKKPQKVWIPYNPRKLRPPPLDRDSLSVKLMSWNVNGLRALLKLEGFSALELAQREDFDILCLQETKLQDKDVESIKQTLLEGYGSSSWTCSLTKLGYSGTAIISRIKPLSVTYGLGIPDHDSEGRIVTAEFDSFYLICAYVPNSGDGLKRLSYRITQWDPSLSDYMKVSECCPWLNSQRASNGESSEIDIFNPAVSYLFSSVAFILLFSVSFPNPTTLKLKNHQGNRRSAGFTDEERQSFGRNFLDKGFVDTFRNQHPNAVGYTYWGYRHGGRKTNKGWRLDYFLVSESLADKVHDSYIVPDVMGSDHCPIGLILRR
ncbi:unnamed protein product [Linum tenue]|uniref:DNA-(apurinic or apyrimidinic site) endonuclease n=1 Tax=Linum tenue TaxID=586396 RepID=A0AAV0RR23_9ROSI|nr:unnamed protein product [Linum tenue]